MSLYMKKAVSVLLLISFGIFTSPGCLLASDVKGITPPTRQSETGLSASSFSELNKNQQDAIGFKNALVASQAQTQPPLQNLAGIEFAKVEEHKQAWKSPSRSDKLKARLKGKRAHGYYVDVVTSKIAGTTTDGSVATDIALNAEGRVSGYTRTRQQTIDGLEFDVKQVVQVNYDGAGNPYYIPRTEASPKGGASSDIKLNLVQLDNNGRIVYLWANRTDKVGLDSFLVTKRVSVKYNADGTIASQDVKLSAVNRSGVSEIFNTNITADSNLRVTGYTRQAFQTLSGVNFINHQNVKITHNASSSVDKAVTTTQSNAISRGGTAITDVSLSDDGLVTAFTEKRAQNISNIQFELERQISGQQEKKSSKYTAPSGVEVSDITTDALWRVSSYTTKLDSQAIDNINFTALQINKVSYDAKGSPTVTPTVQATGKMADGKTISDVTIGADGRVTGYTIPAKTQAIDGITFTAGGTVSVTYNQSGQPVTSSQGTRMQGTTTDGRVVSNIILNQDGLISTYTTTRTQPLNNITFTTKEDVSVSYGVSGNPSVKSLKKDIQGVTTDGTSISNVTFNQNGLVSGYKQTRRQTLSGIRFDLEKEISKVIYDANNKVLNQEEKTSSDYSAPRALQVSKIDIDSALRVKGYSIATSQSISGISFATSHVATVSYNPAGEASVDKGNIQITGTINDGRVISDITLGQDGLISGYKEKRNQTLALIQFDLQRVVSNITYDSLGAVANKNEALTSSYTAKSGIEVSDIKVDSSLRINGYRLKNRRNLNIDKTLFDSKVRAAIPNKLLLDSIVSNISYDNSNKISSLTLDSFKITKTINAKEISGVDIDVELEYGDVRVKEPYHMDGIKLEIYDEFGIPVIDKDDTTHDYREFSSSQLAIIQKVLREVYPANLLDEISTIAGKRYVALFVDAGTSVEGAIMFDLTGIASEFYRPMRFEHAFVHEIAHVIHFGEGEAFKAEMKDAFKALSEASGKTPADYLNYAFDGHTSSDGNVARAPEYEPYGTQNTLEDFATMVAGWWWNTFGLLRRAVRQAVDSAKSILLRKALIVAEVFSQVVNGVEYTYTYAVTDTKLGSFVRESTRIVRDGLGKITKIGDILIPSI